MKKLILVFTHLFYWLAYSFFAYAGLHAAKLHAELFKIPEYFILIVFIGTSSFYASYFYILPHLLQRRKIVKAFLASIAASLLIGIIASQMEIWIVNGYRYEYVSIPALFRFAVFLSAFSFINGILGNLMGGFVLWYTQIRYKEQLEKKNLQTGLALLKAQINPHFLFNTLNNIDVLIEKDNKKASAYLQKLSEILRFMLYENQAERILLNEELSYIHKYIELQKIRTYNDNYVSITVSGTPDNKLIAPMIFIPFIENAFKHSGNKKINDAISISIIIKNETINFSCTNVFDGMATFQKASGLGMDLIKNRLNLLYNKNHNLVIKQSDCRYTVNLTIYLNEN